MSGLWPDIELNSDSIDDESKDEGGKDQENPGDQKQEEVVLVPLRKPRSLMQGDQRSLSQL